MDKNIKFLNLKKESKSNTNSPVVTVKDLLKSTIENSSTNKSNKNSPYLTQSAVVIPENTPRSRDISVKVKPTPKSNKDVIINVNDNTNEESKNGNDVVINVAPQSLNNEQPKEEDHWACLPKKCMIYFSQLFVIFFVIVFSSINLSLNSNSSLWASLLSLAIGYIMPSPSTNNKGDDS